jgi:uncharacterized protein
VEDQYTISSAAELEAVVGIAHEFIRRKIATRLDDLMIEYIGAAPLVFVATSGEGGLIDVSPKGYPAGFVQVTASGDLLIPERPGNQLCIGFRNILRNGRIGLIFVAPNQRETLRVKGTAVLGKDPEILNSMSVGGKPALLYTRVCVQECFIHCGKALVRSNLWRPESWAGAERSIGGRQLASVVGARGELQVAESAARLETIYREQLY